MAHQSPSQAVQAGNATDERSEHRDRLQREEHHPQQDDDAADEPAEEETSIPLYYRVPLLYIEPIFALQGAWMLLSSPSSFLDIVSPAYALAMASFASSTESSSSLSSSNVTITTDAPGSSPYSLDPVRIITDQLGIMQLVFAFNLAVVLRATQRDVGTWRLMCTGMLLSDLLHVAASVREFGLEALATPWRWRPHDWANFVILVSMAAVRVGVVLGIGLPKRCSGRRGAGGRTAGSSVASAKQGKDKDS